MPLPHSPLAQDVQELLLIVRRSAVIELRLRHLALRSGLLLACGLLLLVPLSRRERLLAHCLALLHVQVVVPHCDGLPCIVSHSTTKYSQKRRIIVHVRFARPLKGCQPSRAAVDW